jgi:hypothetical protein
MVATTSTDGSGHYRFDELWAGTYTVRPDLTAPDHASPLATSVTIGSGSPTGTADFTVTRGVIVGGVDRPNVMLCGYSARNPVTFFPNGNLTLVTGCEPDANTQALLITRSGSGYDAQVLQAYVLGGGIVITEYNISQFVWNAVFGTAVAREEPRFGTCYDNVPALVQFTPDDPFWAALPWTPVTNEEYGCGYNVGHYPGVTPLMGWNSTAVAVGYRDLGAGRVWAADWDWQDNEGYDFSFSADVLAHMISHRGSGAVAAPTMGLIATPPGRASAVPALRSPAPGTRARSDAGRAPAEVGR